MVLLPYFQGMNEILGPIYYTLASDPDPDCREFAEADSFFCFTTIMSEIRDNFIKTLDDSQCGIGKIRYYISGGKCDCTTSISWESNGRLYERFVILIHLRI